MKKIIFVLCFSVLNARSFSQNRTIDNLKSSLKKSHIHDTTRINNYLSLAKTYLSIDLDSFHFYNEKGLEKSLRNNNYRLTRAYNNKGLFFIYKSNQDSAHFYFDQALKQLDENDNIVERATVYANYSMSYQNSDDFGKKLDYNLKAIKLMSEKPEELSRLHFNQAVIYGQANLIEQSKKHLKLAYENSHTTKNFLVEGLSLKGLAHYAIEDKKLDSAKAYLEKGLALCEKTESPQICYEITSKLGELYDNLEKYDKANNLLLKAKYYALLRKQPYNIMTSNIFLGQHEIKKENYRKAVEYFEEFNEMYAFNNIPELGQLAFKSWAEAESKTGNFKKSNALWEKYIVIKDSIFSQENRQLLADADAKFETEKKDKELAEQQLTLEKQESELQKKQSQFTLMTGFAIFLLISALLTWFLYQQRNKRKNQEILVLKREQQVKTLESLIEGEEKERFRIAKELHDGVNVDLSAIKYKLTSLLEKNNEVINEAVAMIDKSCEQVRAISHNLVPPALKDFSLLEAIEDFCSTTNTIHKPQVTFQHIGEPISISKKAEVNIFRIVQELINNSIKHAEASEIDVQVSHHNKTIQLTVEDNGKGFEKDDNDTNGIGLENVKSRVKYLNGKLDFNSDNKGTSYIIDINTEQLS